MAKSTNRAVQRRKRILDWSDVRTAPVVTLMHEVLVGVALLFFVTNGHHIPSALPGTARPNAERRNRVPRPTLCNATVYYGDVLCGFLPIVQRVSLVLWVSWLLMLFLRDSQKVNSVGQA